jgi:hypothetical protein
VYKINIGSQVMAVEQLKLYEMNVHAMKACRKSLLYPSLTSFVVETNKEQLGFNINILK